MRFLRLFGAVCALASTALLAQTGVNPGGGTVVVGSGTSASTSSAVAGEPVYNVQTYGAKGDGTTDDTAAIQAAITAASAGGDVFLPSATYKVTAQLTIPLTVRFRGAGESSTTVKCTSTTAVCLAIGTNSTSNHVDGGSVADLSVIGPFGAGGPWTGGAIGVWLGGDPAATVLPSVDQANFYSFQNVLVSGFARGYQPNNNTYIVNWQNTHTRDNQYGVYIPCPATSNGAENYSFHGGALTGGVSPVYAACGMDGSANPNGDNAEFSFDGVSFDYSTGPLIAGARITAHIRGGHMESTYSPFIYAHQATTGTGVSIIDVDDVMFFNAIPGTTGTGTDALFYVDTAYANVTIGDGNYFFSGTALSYLVDWQVPYYAGIKSTLKIAQPWGFDSNFQSTAPGALTNASPYTWGNLLTLPPVPLLSLSIPSDPVPEAGSITLSAANVVNWTSFQVPPQGMTLTHIGFNVATVDATTTHSYDVCVWNTAGTLIADTGALAGGGSVWGTLYAHDVAIAQSSVSLPGGTYLVGWTGNANTAALSTPYYNGQYSLSTYGFGSSNATTGGHCGNVTVPAPLTQSIQDQGLSIVLH